MTCVTAIIVTLRPADHVTLSEANALGMTTPALMRRKGTHKVCGVLKALPTL